MELNRQTLIVGGIALAGVGWYLLRAQGASAPADDEALGPAYISYVGAGNSSLDIPYLSQASTYLPSAESDATAQTRLLSEAAIASGNVQQNVLNTESLLAHTLELVTQQQERFGFQGEYGFTSDILAGIELTQPGAPKFTLKTDYTPKDPSNATKSINDLKSQLSYSQTEAANLRNTLSGQAQSIASLQNQLNALSASKSQREASLTELVNLSLGTTKYREAVRATPSSAAKYRALGFSV